VSLIIGTYLALVYLIFYKFRWLPLNGVTRTIIVGVGVFILLSTITALRLYTPTTAQGALTTQIIEISPQVSGRVSTVPLQRAEVVEEGTILFTIDPTAYQARVDALKAHLTLSKLRLNQFQKLAARDAGSVSRVQQAEAETRNLEAQLVGAQFDLDNTIVRAPSRGMVPRVLLREGTQVSPSKAVLTFMDTSELLVAGLFQQSALQYVKVGDRATISFPALPGRVFESKVVNIPKAIGDVQLMASGHLPVVGQIQTTRLYPIYVSIPEEFPEQVEKIGIAATVTIHTEEAGAFSMIALAIQWVAASIALLI
jgi:RND family efflux transporter MFP subunit